MQNATDFEKFAKVCRIIADEIVDSDGFVSIRNLLRGFHAGLHIRPLLVEGMLASVPKDGGTSNNPQAGWAVLVDSETYPLSSTDIEDERLGRPLPVRFRNTVAHELVHSLAFRTGEFGVRLQTANAEPTTNELVKAIEEDTETLSPLLLWPEKSMLKVLGAKQSSLSPNDLSEIVQVMGLSRAVLINRLRLIPITDQHRFRLMPALKNIGIGIAQWVDKKTAVFRNWPLFINFDRNIVPTFLLNLAQQDRIHASVITTDARFAMCGGWNAETQLETTAGVADAPSAHRIRIEIAVEPGSREAGEQFFFVVRRNSGNGTV